MPRGLRRFQESGQSHLDPSACSGFRQRAQTPANASTFSCHRREAYFATADVFDLFIHCLEDMRCRFELCIYGYVVMPEHVHLLLSEPPRSKLAEAIHYLKLSFAKRLRTRRSSEKSGAFWQKRYYDRNVRDYREFTVKLRYLHRNPVKRGLVLNSEEWKCSSYRHYALRETGVVEIESEWMARDRELKVGGATTRIFLRPG